MSERRGSMCGGGGWGGGGEISVFAPPVPLEPRDLRDLESPRALGCSVPSGSEGATRGPRDSKSHGSRR